MSRSGYSDDCENLELWRGTVRRALQGRRGQVFLMELAAAMDAMPVKELISGELVNEEGECCAIGAVCKARAIDVSRIDYYDPERVGRAVDISMAMAAEIEYLNDEYDRHESRADRWIRMRKWVDEQILPADSRVLHLKNRLQT